MTELKLPKPPLARSYSSFNKQPTPGSLRSTVKTVGCFEGGANGAINFIRNLIAKQRYVISCQSQLFVATLSWPHFNCQMNGHLNLGLLIIYDDSVAQDLFLFFLAVFLSAVASRPRILNLETIFMPMFV